MALTVSIGLHMTVLAVRFVDPDFLRVRSTDPPLEIVLVNARSDARPTKAEALAQANLDGGGPARRRPTHFAAAEHASRCRTAMRSTRRAGWSSSSRRSRRSCWQPCAIRCRCGHCQTARLAADVAQPGSQDEQTPRQAGTRTGRDREAGLGLSEAAAQAPLHAEHLGIPVRSLRRGLADAGGEDRQRTLSRTRRAASSTGRCA